MAKKVEKIVSELKKLSEQKKLIIGTERTIKGLKTGKIRKVFVSSNCPKDVKKDLEYYAKLSNANIVELEYDNEELGTICKKPFSISVASVGK